MCRSGGAHPPLNRCLGQCSVPRWNPAPIFLEAAGQDRRCTVEQVRAAAAAAAAAPAAALQQVGCSSGSACPAHQFCNHDASRSQCDPCTGCAGCLCGLPAAGAADCRRRCLAPPPGPPKHATYPRLPRNLSPTQQQVQRQAATIAAQASPAARPQVAAFMGSAATKKYLQQFDDGSNLAKLSGPELLQLFEAELDVVELVHNFGFPHPRSCGIDVTISSGPRSPDFYNRASSRPLDTLCAGRHIAMLSLP